MSEMIYHKCIHNIDVVHRTWNINQSSYSQRDHDLFQTNA